MYAEEILVAAQMRWQAGSTANTNFNNQMLGAISKGMSIVSSRRDYWFLSAIGTLSTVTGVASYKIGNPAPPTRCVAAAGAAGVLTGNYIYRITFVNAFGESNPGPASNTVALTAQQANLTTIPVAPANQYVTERRIYRSLANGALASPFYYVATLANNVTTIYTDNATDAAIQLNVPLVYQHIIKPYNYVFDPTNAQKMMKISQERLRRFRPDATTQGTPQYIFVIGDDLYPYPVPDAVYNLNYPYFYRWKRIIQTLDNLPEQLPQHILETYCDAQYCLSSNAERGQYVATMQEVQEGLLQLDDMHFAQTDNIKIIDEDEDWASFERHFPDQNYYDETLNKTA